jgi:ATPase subunit of ABC transporter with duplicated ATPase domains
MTTISLRSVSYSYTSAQTIFEDLSLDLSGEGWTGLVGANGAGKTTLMKLFSGELPIESGSRSIQPRGARLLYCEQGIEELSSDVHSFASAQDGEAYRLRGLLLLNEDELSRWPTLSPGERKRWQIGAALYASPEILLLDEPTNHLDQEGKRLLLQALESFSGLGVVVSHDRSFLCALTSRTIRCEPGHVTLYDGNYEEARQQWEAESARRASLYEQSKREEAKAKRYLQEQRERLQQSEKSQSSKHRMKNIKDHDARSMGSKIVIDKAAARASQSVAVARDKAQQASERRGEFQFQREVGRSLFVDYQEPPSPWISRLETSQLKAGDKILMEDVSIALRRGERLWLRGKNGAGKTTLLRALYEASRLDSSSLLWLPQELSSDESSQLLQRTLALNTEEKGRVLSLLAALGVDPERVLRSQRLSHGEARKLALSYGLGAQCWALFLDEPTNHLDLPSIERLEEALLSFPGAMVLISHDEFFARRVISSQEKEGSHEVMVG